MISRQNGEFRRSVISALAAMVAAAVPTLVPSSALAEKNPEKAEVTAVDKDAKAAPAKSAKKAKKTTAAKGQKPAAKAEKSDKAPKLSKTAKAAKPVEADAKQEAKAAGGASASKGKKAKKTAARAGGAKKKTAAKKADSEAPRRPCLGTPITLDRGGLESQTLPLLDCHDRPLPAADEALSVLARPWGAPRPGPVGAAAKAARTRALRHDKGALGEMAPGVKLLDKGLLVRVAAIAKRFGNRPVSLVSGYRPQSRGSLHQSARALDLRVPGVSNEELVAFCKTLKDTGCGYYPNSSFIHVDVRSPGTGTVSWIDTSGPGESPNYVRQWPLPPEESDAAVLPDRAAGDAADPYADDDEHAAR